MVSYPGALDNFSNPSSAEPLNSSNAALKHAKQHIDTNDAIEALQVKAGVSNSLVAGSTDYRLNELEGNWNPIAGEWPTFPRDLTVSSVVTGTGNLRLAFFTAKQSGTTGNVRMNCGNVAAAAGATVIRMGLWTANNNGDGLALVASTVHDATLFTVAAAFYTRPWSVPYAMVKGQRYAFGLLVVSAGTTPSVAGKSIDQNEARRAPVIAAFLSGQANLPASWLNAALLTSANHHYAALTA